MNRRVYLTAAAVAAVITLHPPQMEAHFQLVAPASWLVENNLGDPQKLAPCGSLPPAPANAPAPPAGRGGAPATPPPPVPVSGEVTKVVGGSKLHLKVIETIYHPGHYRVALAVKSRTELPPDPYTFERTTERGPQSVWATIQSPPQIPVIADGLFQHYTRPPAPAAGGRPDPVTYEADIQLPNLTCTKCTLQVIQFMAEHGYNQPGGYSYHHCADLQITADASKPLDKNWPTE